MMTKRERAFGSEITLQYILLICVTYKGNDNRVYILSIENREESQLNHQLQLETERISNVGKRNLETSF